MQDAKQRLPIHVLCKYPFLEASKDRLVAEAIAPLDALYARPGIPEHVRVIISDALENKEKTTGIGYDNQDSMYLYPWLRIVLLAIDMPRVTFKVANLLSKHFGALLASEGEADLVRIARDQGFSVSMASGGLTVNIGTVAFSFTIPFVEYLKIAVSFKAPPWKLVNRPLSGGTVFLRKHDLARMVEEAVKLKITSIHQTRARDVLEDSITSDPLVSALVDDLRARATERLAASADGFDSMPVDDECFPPCLNAILEKNAKGINLGHVERLFLVYFLLTIGKSVEEVLDLFRNQPDYNEKIARYQVEFAAGKQGKGTAYKPHNCDTLASLNICQKTNPAFTSKDCVEPRWPFTNPLTFYRRAVKRKEWLATRAAGHAPAGDGDAPPGEGDEDEPRPGPGDGG